MDELRMARTTTSWAVCAVIDELHYARLGHHPMKSPHEGWAVIREEVDELWEEVKKKKQSIPAMRTEAVQIAAMAIRFLEDLC